MCLALEAENTVICLSCLTKIIFGYSDICDGCSSHNHNHSSQSIVHL